MGHCPFRLDCSFTALSGRKLCPVGTETHLLPWAADPLTGTEPETERIESIREKKQADSFSLAGKLDIADLAALISKAPLLISNNTGPVHMAAVLNTPVVDLYALTNPQHLPWMVPHRALYHDVSCKYCYKSICPMGHDNCLQLVTPEDVVEAVLELLAE
jgi:ADP-heptose:LPS heptosyltransferase